MTRNTSISAPSVIAFAPPPLLKFIQLPAEPVIKCGKEFLHHILITDLKSNKYLMIQDCFDIYQLFKKTCVYQMAEY